MQCNAPINVIPRYDVISPTGIAAALYCTGVRAYPCACTTQLHETNMPIRDSYKLIRKTGWHLHARVAPHRIRSSSSALDLHSLQTSCFRFPDFEKTIGLDSEWCTDLSPESLPIHPPIHVRISNTRGSLHQTPPCDGRGSIGNMQHSICCPH